jgi:hypothetical protein
LGAHRVLDEASTAKEYRCGSKTLPFIALERNEISLSVVKPGEAFRHGFVYVMCPEKPPAPVKVKLQRDILRAGKAVLTDTTQDFELKPGRWSVNALVRVPSKAKPGSYDLQLRLIGPTMALIGTVPFVVQRKTP